MKIAFGTGGLERAPKGYTRVRLVNEPRSVKRLVREGGATWLELGAGNNITLRSFVVLCRGIVRAAREHKAAKIALDFSATPALFKNLQDIAPEELSTIAATAFEMANYEHVSYKTKPKDGWGEAEEILLLSPATAAIKRAVAKGQTIGEEINKCRELCNTPGGDMTPAHLAAAAKAAARGTPAKVTVLNYAQIKKLGMGGVVGVGKGAEEKPQFIIVEYKGGPKNAQPVVLVGKGVTFDTGGLQVKPGDSMYEMHMDMSGGAAVIHAVVLAAKLGIKANVVGLVPTVENATGAGTMRPGDIFTSLSGKTIEILHTDAEGRVILADALTYAKRYNPAVVADAATLTGAALTAFGTVCNAFMTNREDDIQNLMTLAEHSGDYMWPMPLWSEFDYIVKGRFGDVPNIPAVGNTRYAGVIGGGKFLEVFAKELNCPWVHIDIAPKMTANADEQLAKGAAGSPMRFFLALIEKHAR